MCTIITSAKEARFSSVFVSLFVSRIMQKILKQFSQNSVERWHKGHGKVAHGPRKKPLDFGGNLNHAALGLRLGGGTDMEECVSNTPVPAVTLAALTLTYLSYPAP